MQMPGQGRFAIPAWGVWAVTACGLAVAALAGWMGTFTHPQADDYVYATLAREHGLIGGQVEYYMKWNGRAVASAACFFALGAEMPLGVYRAMPLALLFGLLLGFRAFIGALLPVGVPARVRWLLAGGLTLLYFTGAPSMREGFYWLAGSVNYQVSHILGLLLAAILLRPGRAAVWAAPALALLMAMANESGMLVEFLALAAGVVWALRTRAATRRVWIAALIGCAVGMVLDLAAPGLRLRSAVHDAGSSHEKDLLWSLTGSFAYAGRVFLRLLAHPALWGVLILGLPWLVRADVRLRRPICRYWLVLVPLWWLGLIAAALFPVQFASGVNPPGRIMNVAAWVLIAGALPAVACVFALLRLRLRLPPRVLPVAGVLAIAVGLFLNTGQIRLMRDLRKAPQYAREMEARKRMLREAAPGSLVIVPRLSDKPDSIAYHELPSNPEDWHNRVVARYYGLAGVAAESK